MIANYIKILLRSVAQVMFQNNAWTGLVFLLGIFVSSLDAGLGALLGTMVAVLTARALNYNKSDIENGIFGYNGTLVGVAIIYFFSLNWISIILIIIGSILSALLVRWFQKIKLSAYTAPFVISTWLVLLVVKLIPLNYAGQSVGLEATNLELFSGVTKGFAQVMLQGNAVTGLLFLLALFISYKKAAWLGLAGSVLGLVVAWIFSLPLLMINLGLFGYNAVLCLVAFQNDKSFRWQGALAVVFSVFITYFMDTIGIFALTAPFVISTWLFRDFLGG